MAGLLFVSPGSFVDPGDLPQVSPTPVVPVRGATIDWAADRLNTGALSSWTDMLGNRTLNAPGPVGQNPNVVGTGVNRRVTFDGSGQRMGVDMSLSQPLTMAVVARSTQGTANSFIFSGWNTNTWNLGTTSGNRWSFSTGAGSSILSPVSVTGDTNWHVFIIVVNGANSVLSVDGVEVTSSINSGSTWAEVSIGSTASAYHGCELRRLAVVPRPVSAAERYSILTRLTNHYGI